VVRPPAKRKGTRNLAIVIAVVVLLVLAEVGILVVTSVSPTATKTLSVRAQRIRESVVGTETKPGIVERTDTALANFWHESIVPLWTEPTAPEPGTNISFDDCIKCHPDYRKTIRFTHVYIDHNSHTNTTCSTCHVMNQHPSPARPAEEVCAECHDQVNEAGKCDYCHPAGTLPHFYLLGAPRDAPIDCAVCHPDNTIGNNGSRQVHIGDFTGDPNTMCLQCHADDGQEATGQPPGCKSCHQSPGHPVDWIQTHPSAALSIAVRCAQCHTDTWCAMRCHAGFGLSQPALLPLPKPTEVVSP
jgi:hypothetical protein